MTDHQQAAIEALTDEVYAQFNFQYGDFNTPSEEEAESILAAAEPHLRKKWSEEIIDELDAARAAGKVYTYSAIQDLISEGAGE